MVYVGCLWGIRTEVVAGDAFPLVTGLQPWDCKPIANASKVRILHLPPRASVILHLPPRASVSSGCDRVTPAVYGRSCGICEDAIGLTARPAATTFAHRRAKLRQRAALRQPWSVPTQPRCASDSNCRAHACRTLDINGPELADRSSVR